MSVEYCACLFLKERSHLHDHEIATDRLASMLSVAGHHIRHISQEGLLQLTEMIYHTSRSTREAYAIGEAELKKLNIFHVRYHIEVDRFILPDGCIDASRLYVLRVEIKAAIRVIHQIQCGGKPVEAILLNFMSLLSNTFFMMCLYENAQGGIRERGFISRSYI